MNYTFRVDKLIPKSEFMSVTYMSDGYPDYRRNFSPNDFSEESLNKMVEDFAPHVVDFWGRQESHPETVDFQGGAGAAEAAKQVDPAIVPAPEPPPEFDPFTQKIELDKMQDPPQKSLGWTIVELTEEEQSAYLSEWRDSFAVSMSQFRLALYERGIMEAEMSLSSADATAKILWDSSDFVRRNSQRVISALPVKDKELDDFFIYASTLEASI
jgi:hypothetical protein